MDAGYSVLSSDLETCEMFDQYSYKVSRILLIIISIKLRKLLVSH